MKQKRFFGFIEMIGSVFMLLIDPRSNNNKEYLKNKYLKLNRIIGVCVLVILFLILFKILK